MRSQTATLCVQVRRAQDGFCLSRATQSVLRACTPAAAATAAVATAAAAAAAAATTVAASAGPAAVAAEEDWCRLFATNAECDALNTRRLCALHGAAREYEARL